MSGQYAIEKASTRPLRYGGGLAPETHPASNPVIGIALELRRTAHNIEALEQHLAELTGNELVWGPVRSERKKSLAGLGDSYERDIEAAQVNSAVELYLREREHYSRIAKIAIDYDLDKRNLVLAQQTADQIYDAIEAGIRSLGLSPGQEEQLAATMGARLRGALAATGAEHHTVY